MTDRRAPPLAFAERIVAWQRTHGRHGLPWQQQREPYRVWLSEVMLQQTQVATVLAYFDRFVARFPDVRALAAATQDDVLALWSGLGYYGRARHLHRCAQVVVAEHGGEFPRSSEALAELPGIGRSTAAAIAAFCFGERVAILDGNVKRVLARVLAFEADLAVTAAERELWSAATALLPKAGIEAYTQGLMDLGATICLARSPRCLLCPVNELCAAAKTGTQERYPVKSRRLVRGRRENIWLDLRWRGQVWLVRRPATGVWAGLWSWPELDSTAAFEVATLGWPGGGEAIPAFTHVLTHFDWRLQPVRWTFPARTAASTLLPLLAAWPTGRWFDGEAALALGLPAPLRKRLTIE
ncbi:MAG: A/G-specific adenine glycosylase [Pseudomonadota bacterium]|nr:A/G-specific adenine glycosylase [Pseudomonadota bacterium]